MALTGANLAFSGTAHAQLAIINNLEDINLGTWPGAGPLQGQMTHCVGIGSTFRRFTLRVTGSGRRGAFLATNGVDSVAFTVEYNDRRGSGWTALAPNTPRAGFRGDRVFRCLLGRQRQLLRVTIPAVNFVGKMSGNYTGRLTLLVVPQ